MINTNVLVIISIIVTIIGIGVAAISSNSMETSLKNIEETTEQSLKLDEIRNTIDSANFASKFVGFRADVDYWFDSIYESSNSIKIKNNHETSAFLKHGLYLTAYCDKEGNAFSIDQKIIDDQIRIIKFEKRDSLKFDLPEDFLGAHVESFGLRLTVVSHPYSGGLIVEDVSDNKVTHIQYVLSEDKSRWQPTVTSTDGGFECGREPYGSDSNRVDYTVEEDFLECGACK